MKIIIVDDDKLVSSSLKTILESSKEVEVLAIGNNGLEAISLYEQYLPELVLMDIRMDQMNGIEAGEQILTKYPEAKIIYLTTFSDEEYIGVALKIGAKGYILKQNFESILPAIKAVMSGQNVFGTEIISKLPTLSKKIVDLSIYNLTEKEFEIIELIAEGLNNKEIANQLCLGEGTVRNYLSIILEKLDLRDRTQLAIFYYKHLKS